ncbi:OLC1v1038705C1 [Oldenlandia corymbosa var. corymbosa]|uniref:phosphoribosylglycinamide formyltransferase 1 n=1 Tax=Oldenlandia corymbosa var. corymbosa TaxID=529605 RepID=A0AAV1D103_OLDCO|nr:OLC1v1038705C1 [Oldenlandia corymbosa var. corymbosa]
MDAQSSLLRSQYTICKPSIHNSIVPSYLSTTLVASSRTRCSFAFSSLATKTKLKFRACVKELQNEPVTEDDMKSKIRRKSLAVFVSGGGSNFKSLHEAAVNGFVHGDINVLVTNKPDCGGAAYARDNDIPVILFPKSKDGSGLSPIDLVNELRSYNVDFILLAGFLKLIPAELVQAFPRSILNIHPSLLPAFGGKGFYGTKVHKAVISSGARFSGPTIHYVDEEYDRGRILAQRIVPVLPNDTAEELAGRVLHEVPYFNLQRYTLTGCDDLKLLAS